MQGKEDMHRVQAIVAIEIPVDPSVPSNIRDRCMVTIVLRAQHLRSLFKQMVNGPRPLWTSN
jgi:hypothetical protein